MWHKIFLIFCILSFVKSQIQEPYTDLEPFSNKGISDKESYDVPQIPEQYSQFGQPQDYSIFSFSEQDRSPIFKKRCCPYNWHWAIDGSSSMGPTSMPKVSFVRWYFMWYVNQFWCRQYATTYGFNSNVLMYQQFKLKQPWPISWIIPGIVTVSSDPITKYGPAITQALLIIVKYQRINHCVLFWSDGGDPNVPFAQIQLFNFVRKCHPCTICVACFFVKRNISTPVDINFQRTCRSLGARFYAHHDPWYLAYYLRYYLQYQISQYRCKCYQHLFQPIEYVEKNQIEQVEKDQIKDFEGLKIRN